MGNGQKFNKTAMQNLAKGCVVQFRCDTAAELDSCYRSACYCRANHPRDDGMKYKIERSARKMTVTVSLEKAD